MQEQFSVEGSGAHVAPPLYLNIGGGNVPGSWRTSWTKKQWSTRRAVIDRLRYWQSNNYQCLWVTLTSSPKSSAKRLRADFQALRKRIGRELGFSRLEYVCVDTREGHGVLHMIWAWRDPDPAKRASFYVPFDWLQTSWSSLHGAFHVNVKRIGAQDRDARGLSRYIVSQYCAGQNALVRLSQSRMAIPFARMREELLRVLKGLPERYEAGGRLADEVGREAFGGAFNRLLWQTFRAAWDALVKHRSFEAFGVQFVWANGKLERV